MTRRITKIFAMIATIYIVPLLGAPSQIFTLQIAILCTAALLIFLTQPDFNAADAKSNSRTDQGSVLLILALGLFSQVIPVVEWGYFRHPAAQGGAVGTVVGLVFIILGLSFRVWAIRTLGKFFTATVQIVEGHRVVKSGPYAIVRHPSYLGAYIAIVGAAVFLSAPIGTICAAVLMAYAYRKRLAAEETTLIAEFGEEYREYMRTTPAIVPFPRFLQSTALLVSLATLSALILIIVVFVAWNLYTGQYFESFTPVYLIPN